MTYNKKLIIAIDGHSSCGKSTLAKDLAKHFSYNYIDTGAMYRAVTLYVIENKLFKDKKLGFNIIQKHVNLKLCLMEKILKMRYVVLKFQIL